MMIKALAPGMRRGCSWVWLSIVLAGVIGFDSPVLAQATPNAKAAVEPAKKAAAPAAAKDADAAKKADAAKGEAAKDEENAPEEGEPEAKEGVEIFKDPQAEEALKVFKSVPGLRPATPQLVAEIRRMAAGEARVDNDAIQRFVQGEAYELIQRANINALIEEGGRPGMAARAIQKASDELIDALNTARLGKNTAFLSAYIPALVETLSKLLDNNLISRTEAAIILGQTGSRDTLPIFLKQLKDEKQTVQVKIWALRGIANVVNGGVQLSNIQAAEAINAAKTIADFLNNEKNNFWFLQMRGFEALGAMRQSAVPTSPQKAEMATTAMKSLANPDARPEVRASAAWALGMMQVNPAIGRYNFPLVAYNTGRLASELGETVNSSFQINRTRSSYLTGLLVSPIYQTFNGVEGARESGLTHAPALGEARGFVSRVADLTSSVARASVELVRAPNGQIADRQKDLGERVAALKDYLDKNPPKDFHLVPGGPEFRGQQAQVADAPADKRKMAGANGGR